jgi:hypothetical protein
MLDVQIVATPLLERNDKTCMYSKKYLGIAFQYQTSCFMRSAFSQAKKNPARVFAAAGLSQTRGSERDSATVPVWLPYVKQSIEIDRYRLAQRCVDGSKLVELFARDDLPSIDGMTKRGISYPFECQKLIRRCDNVAAIEVS